MTPTGRPRPFVLVADDDRDTRELYRAFFDTSGYRTAEAVSGLSEALRHLERVLDLWDRVPRAEEVAGVAMPTLLGWAGELAGESGSRPGGSDRLGVVEARELYPLAVVLESIAIRWSPAFEPAALEGLREANRRMRAAVRDASAAMLRYERAYMREPSRVERSAVQHDEIIRALERGNHAEAAQRLRRNLTGGLPDLTDALETR